MVTNKHINKICIAVIAVMVIVTILFMYAGSLGVQAGNKGIGYENRLFDRSRVHTIDIVMDDWDELIANATSETYYDCAVVIDGESYKNVAIRGKGNTSLSSVAQMNSERYSFKLEFDHYQNGRSYHGLDKLCLNNIIQDNTYMKDYLAYVMMDEFGVTSPLCSYVFITVNGEDWGLYLAVEGVEDSFLERNYNSAGELYKPDSMSNGGGRGNGRDFDMDKFMEENGLKDEDGDGKPDGVSGNEAEGSESSESGEDFGSFRGGDMPDFGSSDMPDFNSGDMPDMSGGNFPGGNFSGGGRQDSDGKRPGRGDSDSESGSGRTRPDGESGRGSGRGSKDGGSGNNSGFPGSGSVSGNGFRFPGGGNGFPGGGFGGFGGMGGSDVKLKYSDDNADSYSNIFDNAKTDITGADKKRLISSLKDLSNYENLEEVVNMDEVLRYFVVHSFLVNGDSYTGTMVHNYYLHEDDGQLEMIPWDYNLAYGTFMGNDALGNVNDPIDTPVSGGNMDERPMVGWIFSSDEYTEMYHEYYQKFVDEFVESGKLLRLIDETAEMIAPYVQKDATAFCTYEEFQAGVEAIRGFCELRGESVKGQLDGTIPSTEEGQKADSSALIDTGDLNLSDMGTMGGGGKGGFGGGGFPGGGDFPGGSGSGGFPGGSGDGNFPGGDMPDFDMSEMPDFDMSDIPDFQGK